MKFEKYEIILFGFVLVGLTIRIYVSFFADLPWISSDSQNYLAQFQSLKEGRVETYFPNGYPLFILLLNLLFPFFNIKFVLIIANLVLAVITMILVYLLSNTIFKDKTVGLISVLLIALFPNQINYCRLILSEITCLFFLCFSLLLYNRQNYLSSGILGGISTLIRTTSFPIFLFYYLYLLFSKRFKPSVLFICGLLFPIVLLSIYTGIKKGDNDLDSHSTAIIIMSVDSYGKYIDLNAAAKHPEIKTRAEALNYYFNSLINNPIYFAKQRIASFKELWGWNPIIGYVEGNYRSQLKALLIEIKIPFLIIFLISVLYFRKNPDLLLLSIPVFITSIEYTMLVSVQRYSFVAEPFVFIFCSAYLLELYRKFQNKDLNFL